MDSDLQKLRISKDQRASRKPRHTALPWVLLVLALGGGGVWFWGGGAGLWEKYAHAAAVVETWRVKVPDPATGPGASAGQNGDLVVLNATGYIIAAHKIEVASKVMGRVAWIGVEMGDHVEKGQVLVRLEDDEYKARVVQAQGQLDNAKARLAELEAGSRPQEIAQMQAQLDQIKVELATAERNHKRLKDVPTGQVISRTEVDDAQALVESRRAQVDAATQQLALIKEGPRKEQIAAQKATVSQLQGFVDQAMVDMDNTVIKSPLTSTVLERNVEVGEFVTTGFVGDRGAKGYVVSIADLNDLLVELDINQNDFAKVQQDQPCWITTDAYPDRKYDGKVERISPLANRQKATVLVQVRVLKPDGKLKPDMNATVSFLAVAAGGGGSKPAVDVPAAPRVPASAVRGGAVFVVENGKAVRRLVTVGMTALNGDVEIKQGLIGGEDLIVRPPENLREGDKVVVQTSKS
jgi:HlyD family secretion protein